MMPKGHKSMHGYSTVEIENGLGFREIAEKMTANGDEMNHATARNVLLRGLVKFSKPILALQGNIYEDIDHEARRVACDPRFQQVMIDILTNEFSKRKKV